MGSAARIASSSKSPKDLHCPGSERDTARCIGRYGTHRSVDLSDRTPRRVAPAARSIRDGGPGSFAASPRANTSGRGGARPALHGSPVRSRCPRGAGALVGRAGSQPHEAALDFRAGRPPPRPRQRHSPHFCRQSARRRTGSFENALKTGLGCRGSCASSPPTHPAIQHFAVVAASHQRQEPSWVPPDDRRVRLQWRHERSTVRTLPARLRRAEGPTFVPFDQAWPISSRGLLFVLRGEPRPTHIFNRPSASSMSTHRSVRPTNDPPRVSSRCHIHRRARRSR